MFTGFTQETIDFLWGTRFNNEKSWFEAHRDDFRRDLQEPMKALCDELFVALDGDYPELGLRHKVSRIYRDARRLHGQGPYRDHLWFSFEQPTEEFAATPVFWFELSPDGWSYGMGYYAAKALTMAKLRARIDRDPKPMQALQTLLDGQSEFVLDGPSYVREKPCAEKSLTKWYNKKSFSLCHEEAFSEAVFSPALKDRLLAGYRFLIPFYRYFSTLDGDADPRV
ncbi:MAG: DUF2461 domain-containing protein [Oscillospiraceae bacterium]|jgi:uncharacterized protein (TIGR02453 family)